MSSRRLRSGEGVSRTILVCGVKEAGGALENFCEIDMLLYMIHLALHRILELASSFGG